MTGVARRSGAWNRKSLAEHKLAGTFRPDKHGHLLAQDRPPAPVSLAARRRVLKGLPLHAGRVARALLEAYDGWNIVQLESLRAYALSCDRLEQLQTDPGADPVAVHREARINLQLLEVLDLAT